MGKTVPSYRIAVECKIGKWKDFRNALENEEEKVAFDQIMDMCRGLASAGSAACSSIIFGPKAVSLLVLQHKKMRQLETELDDLILQRSGA